MRLIFHKVIYISSLLIILFLFESFTFLPPRKNYPLLTVGSGLYYGGPRHSGGVFQLEYKAKNCFLRYFRPQASLAFPEMRGVFFGAGLGVDFYLCDHLVFTPSFEPGLYYMGRSRNLGHPIEFRSAVELAYEKNNGLRLGAQFYHISNASLGHHNPGANALVFFLGLPFKSKL